MIKAKFVYFSRTLTNDYRWIYSDEKLTTQNKNHIMDDYRSIMSEKKYYLKHVHLLVRQLENGVMLYQFSKTARHDQNSREIYALSGYVFTGFDYEVFCCLRNYIISYYILNQDLFAPDGLSINDTITNEKFSVDFSIDKMLTEFQENLSIVSCKKILKQYANQSSIKNLVILTADDLLPTVQHTNLESEPVCEHAEQPSIKPKSLSKTELSDVKEIPIHQKKSESAEQTRYQHTVQANLSQNAAITETAAPAGAADEHSDSTKKKQVRGFIKLIRNIFHGMNDPD